MPSDYRGRALFDVASYARRGPGRRDRLSLAEVEQVRRTVRRAPEVMVKVLTGGKPTTQGARQHLGYVGREGQLDLETDAGERLAGEDAARRIVDDWDLDLEEHRPGAALPRSGRAKPLKLVHKLVFSMPPGTPPAKVLGAVRDFAREEFALRHRYAFVLHTDDEHPHVHLVVKAVSEQGTRLNIRKETLREWRSRFAGQLRARGVDANATERAARGRGGKTLKDGIYRASLRLVSTVLTAKLREVAEAPRAAATVRDSGEHAVHATNRNVRAGYFELARMLAHQGEMDLGRETQAFAQSMPTAKTDQERMQAAVREVRGQLPRTRAARTLER